MACNVYFEEVTKNAPKPAEASAIRTDVVPRGAMEKLNNRPLDRQRPFGLWLNTPRPCPAATLSALDDYRPTTQRRYPFSGLQGNLGRFFCGEVDLIMAPLRAVQAELQRLKAIGPVVSQINAFVSRYSGVFSEFYSPLVSDSACQNTVLEGRRLAGAGNEVIRSLGGTTVDVPNVNPKEGPDIVGTIKAVAIGGAVVVGVVGTIYLVGPAIRSLAQGFADRRRRKAER